MTAVATFRFYGDLNDFLPASRRGIAFEHPLPEPTNVKDATEAQGVPHVEVGSVLVDGDPVPLDQRLHGGERVTVYPRTASLRPDGPTAPPLPDPRRFALDGHLGALARRLRLLGFDVWYRPQVDDPDLVDVGVTQQRIVLTRDLGLLKRGVLVFGAWVRATDPDRQVFEVVDRFSLGDRLAPFTRCLRCGGLLREATPHEVEAGVPPLARAAHDRFRACVACGNLYWRGTHTPTLEAMVDAVRAHTAVSAG